MRVSSQRSGRPRWRAAAATTTSSTGTEWRPPKPPPTAAARTRMALLGQAQGLGQLVAGDLHALAGGPHVEAAVGRSHDAGVGLEGRRGQPLVREAALHHVRGAVEQVGDPAPVVVDDDVAACRPRRQRGTAPARPGARAPSAPTTAGSGSMSTDHLVDGVHGVGGACRPRPAPPARRRSGPGRGQRRAAEPLGHGRERSERRQVEVGGGQHGDHARRGAVPPRRRSRSSRRGRPSSGRTRRAGSRRPGRSRRKRVSPRRKPSSSTRSLISSPPFPFGCSAHRVQAAGDREMGAGHVA